MTKATTKSKQFSFDKKEVDFLTLLKIIWVGRKKVFKTTMIFIIIGLIIAVFSQKEYTSSTTFLPQTKETSKLGSNLGGLAAMAGINLGGLGSDSGISPMLYPKIVNSISFQLELLQTPLSIKGQNTHVTYSEYYTNIYRPGFLSYLKEYTLGLPKTIVKALRPLNEEDKVVESEILRITNQQHELIKQLREQISINVNDKDGYISLALTMPEALASAELTEQAQQLLQQYIIKLKILKSSEQLLFIQESYIEKEKEFKEIQGNLARFTDRNQNVTTAFAKTKLQTLKTEYDLSYGVYSELAKQLETQKIQVKEDTPVFTILEPVTIPIEKSSPKRFLILFVWTFFGVIIGVGLLFVKKYVSVLKKVLNNQSVD